MTYTSSEHSLAIRGLSRQQITIGKVASTKCLLNGRMGRKPMNLSQSCQQMTLSHVTHMQRKVVSTR